MTSARGSARQAVVAGGAGFLVGVLALAPLWGGCGDPDGKPFREVEERRAPASAQEVATWTEQLAKRGTKWFAFPDPPGTGLVEKTSFSLGHESHRLEVRIRGHRLTMGLHGVDPQVGGGGWLAFAEGRLEPRPATQEILPAGDPGNFLAARVSWSCLGTKLMSGNEGVARLTFDLDGGVSALYVAYGEPELWQKTYGRRLVGEAGVPQGTLKSQITVTPTLPPLDPQAAYRARVRVVAFGGGPLPQALVQLKGVDRTQVVTDENGEAEVSFLGGEAPRAQVFCAGALGYRNGETVVFSDDDWPGWRPNALADGGTVAIELERLDLKDHATYRWQHPSPDADPNDLMACGTCHKWHYDQWQGSRHARSADNGHVVHEREHMLRTAPESPDDCRGCHQPGDAAQRPGGGWSPWSVRASNHCDLCHKVHHVKDLRESGVFGSLVLARPDPRGTSRPGGIHQVFGTAPDVTNAFMGASWNPLFAASHLCAGCHQGGGRWREGAVPKVDTFEEWRAWAAKEGDGRARSCQGCHMPAGTTVSNEGKPVDQMAWDCLHRSPAAVHSHAFEGSRPKFAAPALDVKVVKRRENGRLVAEVAVTNVGAGHRIPTGTWTKHVLVGVWARQGERWLLQVDGDRASTVPGAAVSEPLAAGDWRNPGGFVLGVREAHEASAAVNQPDLWLAWKGDEIVDDRLAPGATRTARCTFQTSGEEEATVVVRVVHRRGVLGAGPAHTPWKPSFYDEPPEVLWLEVEK